MSDASVGARRRAQPVEFRRQLRIDGLRTAGGEFLQSDAIASAGGIDL